MGQYCGSILFSLIFGIVMNSKSITRLVLIERSFTFSQIMLDPGSVSSIFPVNDGVPILLHHDFPYDIYKIGIFSGSMVFLPHFPQNHV